MAVFVTNPRRRRSKVSRRSNGALNQLIAKKLGVKIGTKAGRAAVAAYKREAGYTLGGGMGAALEKARKAKKARTAASKAHTKKTGMSLTAAFLQSVGAKPKKGKGKAPAPKGKGKGKPGAAAPKATASGVMYTAKGQPYIKTADGKAKFISKADAAKMGAGKAPAPKGKGKGKPGAAAPKASSQVLIAKNGRPYIKMADGKAKFISAAEAAKLGGGRKKNPYGFFARRRNAGALDSATGFLKSQLNLRTLAYTGGTAAVVGLAHAYLAPIIGNGIATYAPKIPVVGEYMATAAEAAPYTITGLLAGTVVAGAGAAFNLSPMLYGSAAVLALTSGIVMDTVSYVGSMKSGDKAGLAYSGLAYSGVAVTNPGYSGVAIQNPGYGAADEQAIMAEYGDAQESDSYVAGDDFDDEEGQAFIDGPRAFFARFGRPARVATRIRGPYSRHAGKHGHRWGWLIKLVGFQKAAEIASLPADRRVAVLSALKRQAAASLPALLAQQSGMAQIAQNDVYSVNMTGAGAEGASGSSGYGALVYAGAGY